MSKLEVDVARPIVRWLRREGWEVYQEVSLGYGDSCCDIVAKSGSLLWAVEVKRSKTIALVDQARVWLGHAHLVSVATPTSKRRTAYRLRAASTWDWLCEQFGLGQFEVGDSVRVTAWPRVARRVDSTLRNALHRAQKSMVEAGAAGGGHWTAFRSTVEKLTKLVERRPGIAIGDAVAAIDHHYSSGRSARSTLATRIRDGVIPGIEIRCVGKGSGLQLWPVVDAET